jgi:hypothetical protein
MAGRRVTATAGIDALAPFYEAAAASPRRGRLLLLSWNFPPALTAGSLRWQKMAHVAHEHGWAFDVVTTAPESHAQRDPHQLEELPRGTRVFTASAKKLAMAQLEESVWRWMRGRRTEKETTRKTASDVAAPKASAAPMRAGSFSTKSLQWMPREGRDLKRAYYAWLFASQELAWAKAAADVGIALARTTRYDAIVTSGPPHAAHEGGRLVARAAGIPHIVDMRDPWSLAERLPEEFASRVWTARAARAERRVLRDAEVIITNTEAARRAMVERYPALADRFMVVMNGFDESAPPRIPTDRFTALYAGSIYLDRDPSPLFRAAARVVREMKLTPADFGLEFIGNVSSFDGVSLEVLAEQAGVGGYVAQYPAVPRRELGKRLAAAAMLVSLPQDSAMAIPSKVFEYMPYSSWLLALAERGTATELVLRDTTADVVSPDDEEGLVRVLRQRVLEHRSGVVPQPVAHDRFSRRAQTELLLNALERHGIGTSA